MENKTLKVTKNLSLCLHCFDMSLIVTSFFPGSFKKRFWLLELRTCNDYIIINPSSKNTCRWLVAFPNFPIFSTFQWPTAGHVHLLRKSSFFKCEFISTPFEVLHDLFDWRKSTLGSVIDSFQSNRHRQHQPIFFSTSLVKNNCLIKTLSNSSFICCCSHENIIF